MLDIILKYSSGQPQTITEWMRYVNTIDLRTSIYKTRFLSGSFMYSPFVNMVKHILHDIEWSNLLKCKNDYKRYSMIDYLTGTYRGMFDPVYSSKEYSKVLSSGNVPEYILNVSRLKPMQSLPLDRGWTYWDEYHPVRIIHHDALELVTDLSGFSISFKSGSATRLIGSIDLILLIFKYLKYQEHCNEINDDPSIEQFIHRHLLPVWFEDLRTIWLFNVLNERMFGKFDFTKVTCDQTIAPLSALQSAFPDVYRIQYEAGQKNITFGEFINTEWFGPKRSIHEWISYMRHNLRVPALRQYNYLQFMAELPYTTFVIRLNNLIRTNESTKVNRELMYLLNRYNDMNIYSAISQPKLRTQLEYEVASTLQLASEFKSY